MLLTNVLSTDAATKMCMFASLFQVTNLESHVLLCLLFITHTHTHTRSHIFILKTAFPIFLSLMGAGQMLKVPLKQGKGNSDVVLGSNDTVFAAR